MNWTRREFLATAGTAAAGVIAAPGLGAACLRRGDTFFPWRQVREGVHVTQGLETGGNVMVVLGEDQALVVDAKFAFIAPALRREAEAFGQPVRTLVNTHHHGDHTSGNVAFSGDAQLIAHVKAEPRIRAQFDRYIQGIASGPERLASGGRDVPEQVIAEAKALADRSGSLTPDDWLPDRTIDQPEAGVELPGREVRLRYTGGGHTDNDMTVHLPRDNVLHAGDLLFNRLHPFFDQNGGVGARRWIRSVQAAIDLCDAETVVVPGHGDVSDVDGLKAQLEYLQRLVAEVEKLVKAGTPRAEAVKMSWPFMDGLGFEQIRGRAIGAVYDEVVGERDAAGK